MCVNEKADVRKKKDKVLLSFAYIKMENYFSK